MKFYQVNYNHSISENINDVWNVLAERFGDIGGISQGVIASKYITEQKSGVGTTRYCELPRKGFAKEIVTQWEAPNLFEFEIIDSSMPMEKGGKLRFELNEIDSSKTAIKVHGTFRLKKIALLSPLLKPMLIKIIKQMLVDFEKELKPKL